jgi:uncharacterized protein YcbX
VSHARILAVRRAWRIPIPVPEGCATLGSIGRVTIMLSGINRFPVKSCRGEPLTTATVEPWGLAGDRRWMIVDEDGEVITARETHRMLLIHPELVDGGLSVSAPELPMLVVPEPDGSTLVPVRLWKSRLDAAPAGPEADAWFSKAMDRPAQLVFLDDPTRRPTSPAFGEPDDRVSFADGYPLLLATEESLAALNGHIAEGRLADQGPLPMMRFRPNVVVRGAPAWAEDDWRRIRIGRAEFRLVKGCARCVLTTLDPETAAKGMEPLMSLARHRRWDGATWFAMNLVPDTPGATISVGDVVEVLDAVDPGNGPPR